jgi:hypothetical protein
MVTISTPEQLSKDAPRIIIPTEEELKTSRYDIKNIEAALEALHQDGFVVLKSVVDGDHVDNLNKFMSKEADELVRTNAKPFNQGVLTRVSHSRVLDS